MDLDQCPKCGREIDYEIDNISMKKYGVCSDCKGGTNFDDGRRRGRNR